METDDQFHACRCAEEQRAADRAMSPEANARHRELALLYAARLPQPQGATASVND
jgi:hypothetical protein